MASDVRVRATTILHRIAAGFDELPKMVSNVLKTVASGDAD